MRALLAESLAAGGLGFSSSQSRTHSDGDGNPINSRNADRREMLAFCEEVAAHEGTTLEYITNGCLDAFSDEEIDLDGSDVGHRPPSAQLEPAHHRLPDAREAGTHQLEASTAAAAAGGRIVALTMPTLVPMNMSFLNHCALFLIPGLGRRHGTPVPERIEKLPGPRGPPAAGRTGPRQGGRRLPPAGRLGQLRHRGHLRRGQPGPRVAGRVRRSPPSGEPRRSTPSSTS